MENDDRNDLSKTLIFIRQQFFRASVDSKHELRQVYLATRGSEYPEARTVILRAVEWGESSIIFHTDLRSKKYSELLQCPQASILGYSRRKNFQVRFRGRVILNHKNYTAEKSWQRLGVSSRRCYLASAPGAHLKEAGNGLNQIHNSPHVQMQLTESGFDHFVSATLLIHEIEWLLLAGEGHRRALFKFNEGQENPHEQLWICP